MRFTKSHADNKIRPQGVVSKIDVPLTWICPEDASKFVSPLETTSPKEVTERNVSEYDLYESSEVIGGGDLVVHEEETELSTAEVLEDVGIIDSDDDLDLCG